VACGATESEYARSSALFSPPPKRSGTLTEKLLLIADTQYQHLYGRGAYARTGLADKVASTAVRPAQLDMFASSLVRQACETATAQLIHLGDAANGSCYQELQRFFTSMQECRKDPQAWVLAPGNHDGFFMGNTDTSCDAKSWVDVCEQGNELTKDETVALLVLKLREAWPRAVVTDNLLENEEGSFLVEAAWRSSSDRDDRFESYLSQLIELTSFDSWLGKIPCSPPSGPTRRVFGVVLDTSQYEERPALLPRLRNAGWTGDILPEQQHVIESWVMDPVRAEAFFVLFAHHPIKDLTPRARGFLKTLVERNPNIVLFVSAHTHSGAVYRWPWRGRNQAVEPEAGSNRSEATGDLIELNVGSVIDQPNEWRDLQLFCDGGKVFVASAINPDETEIECDDAWLPPDDEIVGYKQLTSLEEGEMQLALIRAQAASWLRLLQRVGLSDPHASAALSAELRNALGRETSDGLTHVVRRIECIEAKDSDLALPPGCLELALPAPPAADSGRKAMLRLTRERFKRCVAKYASRADELASPCVREHEDYRFPVLTRWKNGR
jgi:hypothetical protein